MAPELSGIFAPLTTPFEAGSENIAPEKFAANIEKYGDFDLAGYVILGSSGENIYLSDDESEALVRTARDMAGSDKILIAGTARESTRLTLEFTNRMAVAGADAALVRTPSYFKSRMDSRALEAHYTGIADASAIPLIVYNIPRTTGISMDPGLVHSLARHPNIAGIKDSSGDEDYLRKTLPGLPSDFSYLLGAAGLLFTGLRMGVAGGIVTVADLAPALVTRLYEEILSGDGNRAREIQTSLIPLNRAVILTYGVPAAKYGLDLLGFYGGPCRLPLLPLGPEGRNEMQRILRDLGLIHADI